MSRRSRRKQISKEPVIAEIESMTHEGRGVTHVDGKAVFVDDALKGETVEFQYTGTHRNYDEARLLKVIKASDKRIEPGCQHFGVCGGCRLQHIDANEQLQLKQDVLIDNFKRLGQVDVENILPPLMSPEWGYRRKARLGVRYVNKKEKMLIGFRERASRYLADIEVCKVLHPSVGEHLVDLAQLVQQLSHYDQWPQIEVAVGDNATALVFRHLQPITDDDKEKLISFAKKHNFHIYLQSKGPDTVYALYPEDAQLYYQLEDYDLKLNFLPTDFTQVNQEINPKMVAQALRLLDLQKTDRVLELFCGLGNFTLPMAKAVSEVVAVEGDAGLIERARANATLNKIDNVEYHVANLMEEVADFPWIHKQSYDKVLLDPPRSGAKEILPYVAKTGASKIVYVSCHPGTLARDAGELVNQYGYKLITAGVMDMFPHTAHVESIALFEKI